MMGDPVDRREQVGSALAAWATRAQAGGWRVVLVLLLAAVAA